MTSHAKKIRSALLTGVAFSLLTSNVYATEESQDPFADRLLGDVAGQRSKLLDAGVDVTVQYKAGFWRNVKGGIKRGNSYLDNLDVKFDLDGEKLFGITGNKSMVSFVNNNGTKPNERQVGSTQGIDNIETSTNTFKLYELWTEQSFLDSSLSVLVGLHDLNSEFMISDMTGNFIKPVFQVNQEFAQTGKNGPSIFPNLSVAGRVKYMPTQESYVMAAAFDGVPGNPDHPHGTHIDFEDGDGLLWIAEGGITPDSSQAEGSPNKLAVGVWTYSEKFDDLVELDAAGNPKKQRSHGAYLTSGYQFYDDVQAGQTIGAFFQSGVGDGDVGQVEWFYATGLVGNGWVPLRPDSEIGLGFTQSRNGDKYVKLVNAAGNRADRNEYGTELYYRDTLCQGVSVQPSYQYVVNPGSDPTVDNASVFGVRFDINF